MVCYLFVELKNQWKESAAGNLKPAPLKDWTNLAWTTLNTGNKLSISVEKYPPNSVE